MEIVLLLAVIANIAATIWYGTKLSKREEYRIEFIQIPSKFFESEIDIESEQQKEILQPEMPNPPVENKNQQSKPAVSYSAWENRTNIPWVESNPPQQPVSLVTQKKDPLARPDGFI